jgi:hypothetical protein
MMVATEYFPPPRSRFPKNLYLCLENDDITKKTDDSYSKQNAGHKKQMFLISRKVQEIKSKRFLFHAKCRA